MDANIFFDTLAQYANDSSAGSAIAAAVAAVLQHASQIERSAHDEAATNIRWFGARPEDERIQVMALADGVKKFWTSSREYDKKKPARNRLWFLELACALYKYLKHHKNVVDDVVATTTNKTRAATTAVVKANLKIINDMREDRRRRNWDTIARTLETITGKRIPKSSLAKAYREVTAEIERRDGITPKVLARWKGQEITDELKAAAKDAYEIPELEQTARRKE